MAEAIDLRTGKASALVDAGVRIGVEDNDVAGAGEGRDRSDVGYVAGREHDGRARTEVFCHLALEGGVCGVRAIGDSRPGSARAVAVNCLHRRFDAGWLEGESQVVVRTCEHDTLAVETPFSGGTHHVDRRPDRIDAESVDFILEAACRFKLV